jgi:hypothetical protein
MEEESHISRRTVVKGIGAAALVGAGLAGSASTAVASTPSDLKIERVYASDEFANRNPQYRVNYGADLKDETAPYSEYTAYGVAKLHNWQDSVEEIDLVGPVVLDSPAGKDIRGRFNMRGKPNRWYRATFTLIVTDSSGQVAFGDTAITNFKYEGP